MFEIKKCMKGIYKIEASYVIPKDSCMFVHIMELWINGQKTYVSNFIPSNVLDDMSGPELKVTGLLSIPEIDQIYVTVWRDENNTRIKVL